MKNLDEIILEEESRGPYTPDSESRESRITRSKRKRKAIIQEKRNEKFVNNFVEPRITPIEEDPILYSRERSRWDPEYFCNSVLRVPNDPWQTECMQAVIDIERKIRGMRTIINHEGRNKISVTAMHGPGKTHWIAKLMHYWQYTREGRIVCTATKERQILTRLWPEFRTIGKKAIDGYSQTYDANSGMIKWNNDDDYFAVAETAKEPENLAGYHHDYLMFLVDEASGINEQLFPVIEGAISTGKVVVLVMIGNPTKTEGTFYLSHKNVKIAKEYFSYQITLDKTPRISKQWLESMENKYGKDSAIYKIRCLGEFAEGDDYQLISLGWVYDSIMDSRILPDGSRPVNKISADIADGGSNETVIVASTKYNTFVHLRRFSRHHFDMKTATKDAAKECIKMMRRMGWKKSNTQFVIDGVGVGAGTCADLIDAGYSVVKFKAGKASGNPKRWANQRAQSFCTFADMLRDGEIKIDPKFCESDEDWDDFYGQCASIRRKEGEDKVERLESKKDMMKRGLKSPDIADAVSMPFGSMAAISKDSGKGNLTSSLIIGDRHHREEFGL